ncbi:S24 family peptidase [Luteimonas sp. MJ293]|uniref:LexA family transcriptional regulator n=1 Tax=Luteimonas sp. MJ146 TaxID=3129240 RepID=UPI0031BA6E5B
MPLKDRLIHAREESGYAEPAAVAHKIGLTPSALYQLESGSTKTLSGRTAVKLARAYPSFRLEWLIEGTGPMRQGVSLKEAKAKWNTAESEIETRPGYVRLHLMDGTASGGDGAVNTDFPEVMQDLEIAEWQLRKQVGFLPEPGRIQIITVRGDSMYPDVKNGDVVMVDTAAHYYDGDGLYLVNIHGYTFVKRLQVMTDGMHIISTNPRYASQVIAPGDMETLHVGGRIVGLALMRSAEEV